MFAGPARADGREAQAGGAQEDEAAGQVVYLASNAYWEPLAVTLPPLPGNLRWEIMADTAEEDWEAITEGKRPASRPLIDSLLSIGARSVVVLEALPFPR